MFCVGVFETEKSRREEIRRLLVSYSIQEDQEMDVIWFTDEKASVKLVRYAGRLHLALVSLDEEGGASLGEQLYSQNPDCRICYYRTEPCPLEPLLRTRPRGFCRLGQSEERFLEQLREILQELRQTADMFHYETKRRFYVMPFQKILYLQSDLKYVRIHTTDGEEHSIYAKLSETERCLTDKFIRIHKSYIINSVHLEYLDRSTHTVHLDSGEELPVSAAQYEKVIEKLKKQHGNVMLISRKDE